VGCGCGGSKNKTPSQFVYTNPMTGKQVVYNSEIEAKAATIRNGGGHYTAK
jgi:hypothetical protein